MIAFHSSHGEELDPRKINPVHHLNPLSLREDFKSHKADSKTGIDQRIIPIEASPPSPPASKSKETSCLPMNGWLGRVRVIIVACTSSPLE